MKVIVRTFLTIAYISKPTRNCHIKNQLGWDHVSSSSSTIRNVTTIDWWQWWWWWLWWWRWLMMMIRLHIDEFIWRSTMIIGSFCSCCRCWWRWRDDDRGVYGSGDDICRCCCCYLEDDAATAAAIFLIDIEKMRSSSSSNSRIRYCC